jgi:ABC-type multidrug transport system fused ATPase/permease subunit
VLDEPTASMDAEAETKILDRFREVTRDKIAIVISHRLFKLLADPAWRRRRAGRALPTLFNLQAQGYR